MSHTKCCTRGAAQADVSCVQAALGSNTQALHISGESATRGPGAEPFESVPGWLSFAVLEGGYASPLSRAGAR